jgi:hypothetical protein
MNHVSFGFYPCFCGQPCLLFALFILPIKSKSICNYHLQEQKQDNIIGALMIPQKLQCQLIDC